MADFPQTIPACPAGREDLLELNDNGTTATTRDEAVGLFEQTYSCELPQALCRKGKDYYVLVDSVGGLACSERSPGWSSDDLIKSILGKQLGVELDRAALAHTRSDLAQVYSQTAELKKTGHQSTAVGDFANSFGHATLAFGLGTEIFDDLYRSAATSFSPIGNEEYLVTKREHMNKLIGEKGLCAQSGFSYGDAAAWRFGLRDGAKFLAGAGMLYGTYKGEQWYFGGQDMEELLAEINTEVVSQDKRESREEVTVYTEEELKKMDTAQLWEIDHSLGEQSKELQGETTQVSVEINDVSTKYQIGLLLGMPDGALGNIDDEKLKRLASIIRARKLTQSDGLMTDYLHSAPDTLGMLAGFGFGTKWLAKRYNVLRPWGPWLNRRLSPIRSRAELDAASEVEQLTNAGLLKQCTAEKVPQAEALPAKAPAPQRVAQGDHEVDMAEANAQAMIGAGAAVTYLNWAPIQAGIASMGTQAWAWGAWAVEGLGTIGMGLFDGACTAMGLFYINTGDPYGLDPTTTREA